MLMLSAVILILLLSLIVVGFFYVQLKKKEPVELAPQDLSHNTDLGTCAKCQQQRIIVKKEASLCAYCWSSVYTKRQS